jgi:large subunit ribosomal protein L10
VGRAEREQSVQSLHSTFGTVKMAVLAEYRGLTVAEITSFRVKLRKAGAKFTVSKNTLAQRASAGTPMEAIRDQFIGPVGLLYTTGDPVAAAKALVEFLKENQKLVPRTGILEGKPISFDQVKGLAELPSREVLLARLLGSMQSPATGFVRVLSEVPAGFVRALEAVRKQKEAA